MCLPCSVTDFESNLDKVWVERAQLSNENSEVKLLSQSWEGIAWETHINPGIPACHLTTQMKRQSGHCLFPLKLRCQGSALPFLKRVMRNLMQFGESKNLVILPQKLFNSPGSLKDITWIPKSKITRMDYFMVWSWLRLLNTWKTQFPTFCNSYWRLPLSENLPQSFFDSKVIHIYKVIYIWLYLYIYIEEQMREFYFYHLEFMKRTLWNSKTQINMSVSDTQQNGTFYI